MYKKERIFFFFYRELQTYGKKLGLTSEPIVEFSYFDKKKKMMIQILKQFVKIWHFAVYILLKIKS